MMADLPFAAINAAALRVLPDLLAEMFPNGRPCGREFVIGNINGDPGRSLSVNTTTGVWRDFAGTAGGSDPISLYADACCAGDQGAAARALGAKLGVYLNGSAGHASPASIALKLKVDREPAWKPMVPPPANAPPAGKPLAGFDQLYDYRDAAGRLLFYIRRREARGGKGKLFTPLTYGELDGVAGWHPKAPDAPRPLYGLDQLAARSTASVIVCEGEKAAIAAAHSFPDHACVSWPGGANAVDKADWTPLTDRDVIVWPDADVAGRKAAAAIVDRLPAARMLRVNDLPEGHDAADVGPIEDPEAWLLNRLPVVPPPASPTALWSASDDWEEAAIPPRPWIARGYLLRGSVTVVSGAGSAGKSSLMCSYAAALGLGKPCHRMIPTRAYRVLTYNV